MARPSAAACASRSTTSTTTATPRSSPAPAPAADRTSRSSAVYPSPSWIASSPLPPPSSAASTSVKRVGKFHDEKRGRGSGRLELRPLALSGAPASSGLRHPKSAQRRVRNAVDGQALGKLVQALLDAGPPARVIVPEDGAARL